MKKLKKEQVPFSRIPADQAVDPRFASNAYVPYDYAERAHRDLIVTKGKGFTKEKNKKKRGKQPKAARENSYGLQSRKHSYWDSKSELELSLLRPHGLFEDNPLGFKEDLWELLDGCDVHPLGGGW